MMPFSLGRAMLGLFLAGGVAACGSIDTVVEGPADPAVAAGWRVDAVEVTVPETLSVATDGNVLIPTADIVWFEDGPGDTRAQVAGLVQNAVTTGAAGLAGDAHTRLVVTVERFHALTPRARSRPYGGIHSVHYTIQVVDNTTGAPIFGPGYIEADLRAFTGNDADTADAQGQTQRARISARIAEVTAAWLGQAQVATGSERGLGG